MKKINKTAYSFLFLFVLFFGFVFTLITSGGVVARAASSSVLDDLRKDSDFSVLDYPVNDKDYSIYVIQIAESTSGGLYLYTYQPFLNSKIMYATDINMSLSEDVSDTKLYELEFVHAEDVFCKYLVEGVKVSDSAVRYYNITSVYRDWDKEIDGETGTNNTGEKKAFSVRNIYKVTTENGEKKYQREETYVVNILNPYTDFLLYTTYASLPNIPSLRLQFERMEFMDAHYIAFSTDWEIDRLLSATVTYTYCTASGTVSQLWFFPKKGDSTFGDKHVGYAYPTYSDKTDIKGNVWFSKRAYSWDRIQSVAEFTSTESNLTDETKTNLEGKQWVLRFLETERKQVETSALGYKQYKVDWTEVSAVSVLRLEFETNGVCYNLGAVSDAVSGDSLPGNAELKEDEESGFDKFSNLFKNLWNKIKGFSWGQWLLICLAILFVIFIIIAIAKKSIKAAFSLVGLLIQKILEAVGWVVMLPFRGIKALISKKDKNEHRGE